MSMNIKVIGLGAAGNKAAIKLIEKGILDQTDVLLMNTTLQDLPNNYKTDLAIKFGDDKLGGCGKDRSLAKRFMIDHLRSDSNAIDEWVLSDMDTKFIVIVSSTEGGTGSGSSPILAKYIQNITSTNELPNGIPMHLVSFTGFEDDVKGLKNSLDWFGSLDNTMVVQSISNKSCLEMANGSRREAENLATRSLLRE